MNGTFVLDKTNGKDFNRVQYLGIEIDENHVKEMGKVGHDWKNPVWRHRDGSVCGMVIWEGYVNGKKTYTGSEGEVRRVRCFYR